MLPNRNSRDSCIPVPSIGFYIMQIAVLQIETTRSREGEQVPLEEEASKSGSYMDVHAGNTLHRPSDGAGISEIEQMLKGKTLSRQVIL
ncbi:hypothetical protein FRX31_012198 [Thalictrum thalictroides]|uniref:Uncharacterized protein n=1 Tax=Thalictrum thalictroides TaxID=46969 RepID=A0A7J6WLH0_THATH|nr:hypothetical protein FRX31_012198 [Thalictrum thalictroides]